MQLVGELRERRKCACIGEAHDERTRCRRYTIDEKVKKHRQPPLFTIRSAISSQKRRSVDTLRRLGAGAQSPQKWRTLFCWECTTDLRCLATGKKECTTDLLCLTMGKEKECTTDLLCLAMGKEECTIDLLCLAMGKEECITDLLFLAMEDFLV